ncbi:non-specific lipid transfer protein GPI-anchored 16-like [Vicia villosa]|uniref:non-specific lipid transfer protein GPI-anchored 16-like n=1 Tax=Vicia villosa TaxID=3911 RepID=UPI00273B668D|nr:non-specific lipid transfer protein GPI-anchored 16-like [Vicia villosa]
MALISLTFLIIISSLNLINGQISSSSCTSSMISSTFTPCANIITGSTNNGLVPSSTCCESLRSLISTNMDCACLVMSSNSPFYQVLAMSLTQACNIINGGSVQCKGVNSPISAPSAPSPLSPQDSKTLDVDDKHIYENLQLAVAGELAPSSAPMEAEAPSKTSRIIPVLTPLPHSASSPCYYSPSALFIGIAVALVFGFH